MFPQHSLRFVMLLAVLLIIGACGTGTTAPTPATGALTTPTTATQQILVGGLLQRPEAGNVAEYGIYGVDRNGANLHRLGASGMQDVFPSWSPDGQHIIFTRLFSPPNTRPVPKSAIMVMDADGSNERVLTDANGTATNAVWSPDGQQIAFERVPSPPVGNASPNAVISVMNADGSNLHDISPAGYLLGPPSWSPDSARLVFARTTQPDPSRLLGSDVYVADADGTNLHAIVHAVAGQGAAMSPRWSPDGSTISYVTQILTPDLVYRRGLAIGVVAPDGTNPRLLTRVQFLAASRPSWSPDRTQIAFEGVQQGEQPDVHSGIYLMDADGSNVRQLVAGHWDTNGDPRGDLVVAPSWSPDGRDVAFVALFIGADPSGIPGRLAHAERRVASVDGSGQRTVVSRIFVEQTMDATGSPVNAAPPIWRPTGQ